MAWPGLREAKRAEMERRLAEIAYALIRERGFGRVTVEDIVDEARVSRRTFSNYYSCKEEAVAAVILHDAADALDRWQPEPHDGLVDLVRSLVHHQFAAGVLARLAEVAGLGRIIANCCPTSMRRSGDCGPWPGNGSSMRTRRPIPGGTRNWTRSSERFSGWSAPSCPAAAPGARSRPPGPTGSANSSTMS